MVDQARTAVIADVDEFFRLALSGILTRDLGFTRIVESSSPDAVFVRDRAELLGGLIVVDVSLLGGDYDVIRSLRRQYDARVVIVSASRHRDQALRSLDAGAHGYVGKGGSIAELTRALVMVLDGFLWLPPFVADLSEDMGAGSAPHVAAPAVNGGLETLTTRQREVLQLVVQGKSNKEIARKMNLREGTIKVHMAGLFRSLGVVNRSSAAVLGARLLQGD